jgi:hypothetical protein
VPTSLDKMSVYYVDFVNNTDETWVFGVYQTIPEMTPKNLENVSWKQSTVPRGGRSGVRWTINYNVLLADYQQSGGIGVYYASQTLTTTLGKAWEVVYQDNVQQLQERSGTVPPPDSVTIYNASGLPANPGIGMDGAGTVYKKNLLGNLTAVFQVTPTYWVAAFNQLQLGQVISSAVYIDPTMIVYNAPYNLATATLYKQGSTIKMDITYGTKSVSFVSPKNNKFTKVELDGGKHASALLAYVNSSNFHYQAAGKGVLIVSPARIQGHNVVFEAASESAGGKGLLDTLTALAHEEGTKIAGTAAEIHG